MKTMNEERVALAEKLRTDAIAIFGEGQAERDIIEWFYGSLLAAAPAPVVPDRYVLVPVEPTPEMIQAALDKPCFDPLGDLLPWTHITRTSYAAMLAAAPAHPAERQEQGEVQRLRDVLDEYERQTKALPCQHEIPERGCSTYNWRMSVIRDLRAMLAASAGQGVGK